MIATNRPRSNHRFGDEAFQVDRATLVGALQRNAFEVPERELKPGVYLLTRQKIVVYVGSSVQPMQRIAQHKPVGKSYGMRHALEDGKVGKEFDGAWIVTCESWADAVELEGALIRQLEPELNGGWHYPKNKPCFRKLRAPNGDWAGNDIAILAKHGLT